MRLQRGFMMHGGALGGLRLLRAFSSVVFAAACWKTTPKLGQIDDIRWFRGIKFGWYWRLRRARKNPSVKYQVR